MTYNLSRFSVKTIAILLTLLVTACVAQTQAIDGDGGPTGGVTYVAPAPNPLEGHYSGGLRSKLAQRRAVNVFLAWNQDAYDLSDYGLRWTDTPRFSTRSISLAEVYWSYHYPGTEHSAYPGIERYLTDTDWDHAAEYGRTLVVDYSDATYPEYMANLVASRVARSGADGVMFDWWHNEHPVPLRAEQVSQARRAIARSVRTRMGRDFIILGNTNWSMDRSNHDLINGVFLELYKEHSGAYTLGEIARVEELLIFHNRYLSQPKLIALEPWRITRSNSGADRFSAENRRYAGLFAAMSSVVPENGYILYADNNQDRTEDDHAHAIYDFYNIDLGRPTSSMTPIRRGVAYKAYERGLIAYNRTNTPYTVDFDGNSVVLHPLQGVFCKAISGGLECL